MAPHHDSNGWDEWQKYVLSELTDNKSEHKDIASSLGEIKETLAEMRGAGKTRLFLTTTLVPAVVAIGVAAATIHCALPQ